MKKRLICLLIIASLCLCGCGREDEPLGVWEVPEIEYAPTVPTPTPIVQGGVKVPEIVWNTADELNMSNPGVQVAAEEKTLSHKMTLLLFPWNFLPEKLFNSYDSPYESMTLEKAEHGVLLDEAGVLVENAYVQYRYLTADKREETALILCAELISRERQIAIYEQNAYPHVSYGEGTGISLSRFGLESFVLGQCGELRYGQILLPLPKNVGGNTVILLTLTCGAELSDEAFVDAILELWEYQILY